MQNLHLLLLIGIFDCPSNTTHLSAPLQCDPARFILDNTFGFDSRIPSLRFQLWLDNKGWSGALLFVMLMAPIPGTPPPAILPIFCFRPVPPPPQSLFRIFGLFFSVRSISEAVVDWCEVLWHAVAKLSRLVLKKPCCEMLWPMCERGIRNFDPTMSETERERERKRSKQTLEFN